MKNNRVLWENELSKTKRISVFRTIILVLVGAILLSACSFGVKLSLSPPVLLDDRGAETITWYSNSKASGYEVYVNNAVVYTVEETGKNTYSYYYGDDIISDGLYNIKAKCIGGDDYKDSRFSNVVTIRVGENPSTGYDTSEISIVRDSSYAPNDISYLAQTGDIWWSETKKNGMTAEKYIIQIFCNNYTESIDNTDKIRSFYVIQPYFNVEEYLKGNEVLAISVSSVYEGDDNLYASDVYYHNPLNSGVYSEVYVFDGGVYDKYIEDYDELQNIYYYAYITRQTEIKFMVSSDFYNNHKNDYFNTSVITYRVYDETTNTYKNANAYKYQLYMMGVYGSYNGEDCYNYWSYYETYNFSVPTLEIKQSGTSSNVVVTLSESFANDEPTMTVSDDGYVGNSAVSIEQFALEKPYYETVDYTTRESSYDNFASDKCVLTAVCNTSEELYWAVENNVTPIFTDTTSRAYIIYNNAKRVLKEIICDEMTNYEKALSIFDWVANTCQYDYNGYYDSASTDNSCYYLEGMFMDKNHVVVCDGISKAYSLLCNMEGIDCLRIMGTASGGGHAWNKVKLSGYWYVVDITWTEIKQNEIMTDDDGNTLYTVERYDDDYYREPIIVENAYEYNCHQYFLVSDNYISSTHAPFANRTKINNATIPADNMYGFYLQTVVVHKGVAYSRVIDSNEDMEGILDYIYCNDIGKFEIVLDETYFKSFGYNLTNLLQTARGEKIFIGIENSGWVIEQNENKLTYINTDGSTVEVKKYNKTTGQFEGTYNCKYENDYETGLVTISYKYGNTLMSIKRGYILYIGCNTNIIDVDITNISDSSNRYNKFVEYVKDLTDFDDDIMFQDEFLTEVVGVDFDTDTQEQIIQKIKSYLENDLNNGLTDSQYEVNLTFIESGENTSNVYNSETSAFNIKIYMYHSYYIQISLNTIL